MTRLLLLLVLCLAASVHVARAQFVATPIRVTYQTNGDHVAAVCTYYLHPDRTYIGEQVDLTGRRLRTVGLAQLTTGGGTVTHHWQIQSSTVQPPASVQLFRVVDATGASASRIAELRDIPLSLYPPPPTLVPTGTPIYKTTLSSGVFRLTAERKFGEWFLLEEWRNRVWSPARWMPLGGKSSVVLGQRYVGTGDLPAWRVTTWKAGPAHITPPLPPGFTPPAASATPEPPAEAGTRFAPSSAPQPVGIMCCPAIWPPEPPYPASITATGTQATNTILIMEAATNPAGPWTHVATLGCWDQTQDWLAVAPANTPYKFIRGRHVPCTPTSGFAPASADLRLGHTRKFGLVRAALVVGPTISTNTDWQIFQPIR